MVKHSPARSGVRAVSAAVLQGSLALLLLLLPLLDAHADTTLAPIAPGTAVATEALHPGAAAHVEASGTQVTPRCPACDLAHQSAGTLSRAWLPTPSLRASPGGAAEALARWAAPTASVRLRGPPSV